MALTNTKARYGTVAQILHWITALLIIGLLITGTVMTYLPDGNGDQIARKVFMYSMHKTIGVTMLAVAILRIVWALGNARPQSLHPERKLETLAAETVHWILYIAILVAPVTGLLHHAASTGFAPIWWPFGQDLPFVPKDEQLSKLFGALHWAMAICIGVSLTAHIAGAIKHAVIDRDETLSRMVPGRLADGFELPMDARTHVPSKWPGALAFVLVALGLGAVSASVIIQPTQQAGELQPLSIDTAAEMKGDHPWRVDPGESRLQIRIQQLGSPVEGEFENWTANINLDPDNVESGFVDARIDISSLKLGTVSDQAKSSDFLNSEAYPQARFLSDFFWLRSDGRYEAEGLLEIAGVQKPFTLVFALNFEGERVAMQAYTAINRMEFGVGAEKYATEESVAFAVEIGVDLVAEKQW